MKKNTYKKIVAFSILVFSLFFFLAASNAMAQSGGIIPDGGKKQTGNYELNDFVRLGLNVSQWILGITGSLALLFFVYGGFTFLISAGDSSKVDEGKKIISGAIIGLILVFSSYMIIQFAMKTLGVEWKGTTNALKIDTNVVK
ncbi:MAG: pilin [Candidatus Falkowbacteria bacterium]